eukprot:Seg1343.1 transcript_id=Seg1343.1/GoldUCD/mRNA.D3Y31 product="hypothetical protein" protein_id=Seg1343.1/GoldUCD/D3Y31
MASSYLPWDHLPNSKYAQNGDGVAFFMQFPRNYLQPYGQAKSIPDQNTILRRLKHFCCEWLKRPKTAASELYSSIAENLVLLLDADNCIGKEEIANVAQCHEMMDFLRNASMFHRFAEPKGGMPEAKKLVEHLLQQNERLDNFFSRAFLMGNALFTMATHWFVARTLMGNPDELAAKMEVPGYLAAKFKWSRNLMDFLPLIAYQSISNMGARNEGISDNIAHILARLGVPEVVEGHGADGNVYGIDDEDDDNDADDDDDDDGDDADDDDDDDDDDDADDDDGDDADDDDDDDADDNENEKNGSRQNLRIDKKNNQKRKLCKSEVRSEEERAEKRRNKGEGKAETEYDDEDDQLRGKSQIRNQNKEWRRKFLLEMIEERTKEHEDIAQKQIQVEEEAEKIEKSKTLKKKARRKRCKIERRSEEDREYHKQNHVEEEAGKLKKAKKAKKKKMRKQSKIEGSEEEREYHKQNQVEEEADKRKKAKKAKKKEVRKKCKIEGRSEEERADKDKRESKEEEAQNLKKSRKLKKKKKTKRSESKGRNEEKKEGKERTEEEADKLEKSRKSKRKGKDVMRTKTEENRQTIRRK